MSKDSKAIIKEEALQRKRLSRAWLILVAGIVALFIATPITLYILLVHDFGPKYSVEQVQSAAIALSPECKAGSHG